ncbi:hypothetical protein EDD85DRAFT_956447 [Armillaria nabsnona]|nr:hypothetical protein EDD85DRAFT_956447 [Armillaria nabsnona]
MPRHADPFEEEPYIQVDPLDLEGKTYEEKIQMAIKAIERNGFKKTTLTERFHRRKTRLDSHEHERRMSHGVHPSAAAIYASKLCREEVGENYVCCFRTRHPELKAKWTTGLEKCQVQALNPTATADFFKLLKEITEKYDIMQENIYNMDEKGIQFGVGKCVLALVDRDQKDVYQVEDGNSISGVQGWMTRLGVGSRQSL